MDAERWRQVRELFEQVCTLPDSQWREELEHRTSSAELVTETLRLLGAQTAHLNGMSGQLDQMLQQLACPELGVGDQVGSWRLVRHLASGGMGSVFVAERADALYEQRVAVKLLRGLSDPYTARQFADERQILANLQHPSIARLYDGGTTPLGQPYLVMEYIEGETLDAHLRSQAVGLDARLDLFVSICQAVQAAHGKLVLHCDLKPSNVMVNADGAPVLLDFGIARLLDRTEATQRARFCTLPYASPELLTGRDIGMVSDVFSLGVMLLELAAGSAPVRTLDNHAEPLPRARLLARGQVPWARRLDGDFDAVVARACAIDPDARYATVAEFVRDLQRWRAHYPVAARRGGRLYRAGRLLRRRWRASIAAACVLAIVLAFMWSLRVARDDAREQAKTAQRVSDFLVTAFKAADPRARGRQGEETITARQLLDASARSIDQDLAATPTMRARLRGVLGRAYLYLGLSTQAEALLRQAALEAKALDMPYELSSAQHDLALMLSNQNHGEEALAMANSSLAQAERTDDPGMVSGSLNMVGLALKELDRYPEAEDALLRALAMRREQMRNQSLDGADGANDGSMLHNLALVRKARGDLSGAERYFREALEAFRAQDGDRSYQYRSSLQGLALVLRDQGHLKDAAELLERNLALALAQLGDGPNEVVQNAYQELAGTYQDLGDLVRSRDYYQKAREAMDALGEAGSLDDAVLLNNFATLQELHGDVASAEALYRRSWGIRRDALGAEARMSLTTEANLGRLLLRTGRMDQAAPLLQHSYEGLAKLFDADNPTMMIQRLTRVELWMRRGDLARARRALAEAVPAKGWSSMPQPLQDRRDMLSAEIAQRGGDAATAAEAWQALVDRSQASQDPSGVPLAKLRLSLAETLAASGNRASARTQLALARPILTAQLLPGAEPRERLKALDAVLKETGTMQ